LERRTEEEIYGLAEKFFLQEMEETARDKLPYAADREER
jgi:hypothetical protein